jgi:NADH dehydrogenase/NADH:ubiquinone oxidoreductase subunit G
VLRERGIDIPTLCHLDGLSERGGCRLCMVEMVGTGRLQAACVQRRWQEGMVVRTAQRTPDQIPEDDSGTALLPNAITCAPSA